MNTNEELFNQLRAKFSDLTMGDADAQSTTDPKMAQFFSFEYKDHPVSVTCLLYTSPSPRDRG